MEQWKNSGRSLKRVSTLLLLIHSVLSKGSKESGLMKMILRSTSSSTDSMNNIFIINKACSQKKQQYQQAKKMLQWRTCRRSSGCCWHKGLWVFPCKAGAVHGPKITGTIPDRSSDKSFLLTDKSDILACWAELINSEYSFQGNFHNTPAAIQNRLTPQKIEKTLKELQQTTSGKAPGDGLLTDIYV